MRGSTSDFERDITMSDITSGTGRQPAGGLGQPPDRRVGRRSGAGGRRADGLRGSRRRAVLQRGLGRRRRRRARCGVALRAAAAGADAVLVVTPNTTAPSLRCSRTRSTGCRGRTAPARSTDKPLAVIGSALGQYGGVWAHDDTRKSFGIAGPRVDRGHHGVRTDRHVRRQAPAGERRAGAGRP